MKYFICSLILFIGIMSADIQSQTANNDNPFFTEYTTPFQTPPFDKIKIEHYLPAFEEGIKIKRAEVEAIINNPDKPTFENTIAAIEKSGKLLRKVSSVFFNLSGSDGNDETQKIAETITPELSKLNNDIFLNEKLYQRVKAINDEKDNLNLTAEQLKVLDNYYSDFVRNGIGLDDVKKARLKEINQEISMLSLKFGDNLRKETNAIALVIDNKDDLIGLPDVAIQSASELAEHNGLKGKWAFNLQRTSFTPFLQYSEKRNLREKLYKAYLMRGNNNNEFDNKEIIKKMIALRIEKVNLLGYKTFADFKLEKNMAKDPEIVNKFLADLWAPALKKSKEESADMQKIIDAEGGNFKLAGWDWWYYAEKVKKDKYALDEEMLCPYFKMENVRQGAFDVANKLYGIQIIKRDDIPVYEPDVDVFEVKEADGTHIGIFYTDYYPRSGKRAGAWMSGFRGQSNMDGEFITPLVVNVGNFSKPTKDKPALLSFDEVNTLFHEFGHALNGLFTKSTYPGAQRSSVDFVELPSQIMENWASHPEVIKMYAKHYQTGETIPDELIQKIVNSQYFNKGFETLEYLAAAILDMDWHMLTDVKDIDVEKFEEKCLNEIGLIPEIASRYQSTNFNHIFGGDGYSAGYYGYKWSGVLDSDAFSAFLEHGLYDHATAESFRRNILEKSGSDDPMVLYIKFRGREPKPDALIHKLGFN
ncbi:MAG TPA: M3 family metallopeptidase [Ignavibacteriaceae bacterium]|nr:MAG: Peptidyl-dipeptidase dcp [Ignavibacteria bacterium ADurb.Bin266]OQY70764.1 MAG: peptidase M3 [Ignavibacteriales bacterium UTCHB2]HQF42230.1 M3 family metallopeptidase [Ignavibacteriaceae bacterium]HQI40577.1 M3 family metallopeptidase [Ignavibacteriaceae bacterium]HQJ46202.1 M3 family metallopeptidase [Ignavibacteriaceae bacterium]